MGRKIMRNLEIIDGCLGINQYLKTQFSGTATTFGSNLKGLFHHFEDRKHDDVLFDRERARAQ